MEDTKKTTQSAETAQADVKEESNAGKFTQTDMDNLAGKIRNEEKAKNQSAIDEAVKSAIAEYERKAKLSDEEREKEARSAREKELQERENNITLRERRIQAQESLQAKNIPIDLVDFVIDLDENKMNENINKLIKTYNKSVENGVTDKLKGTPPTDFSNSNDTNTSTKKYSGRVSF